MWNQWRTDSYDGMTAEMITIKGYQGDDVHAYVARPNGAGPYPGVVLVHPPPGLGRALPRVCPAICGARARGDLSGPLRAVRAWHTG